MTIDELEQKHYDVWYKDPLDYRLHSKLSIEFAISVLNECYNGINPDNSTEEDIWYKIQELKTYLDEKS